MCKCWPAIVREWEELRILVRDVRARIERFSYGRARGPLNQVEAF